MVDAAHDPGEPAAPGSFQSLYRRFRPQRFADVLGQDHVVLALRNAVREGHVAHAYLFSGPRGTGKTSTARILAKALNCAAPDDGEPCDACESCRSIRAGSSFDVHELDAASNNGVEPMRDLVARAALATPGRWKVYIVDEVHMLSAAASNALLKTLEEPPAHVVFVLATTDPQKVLPTIRSRTQHFEFRLLADEALADLLGRVAAEAALELPPGALALATRRARGSARDALSVLDQVAASGVADDDEDLLASVVTALADRDPTRGLGAIDAAIRQGRDPQQLALELVEYLRDGFLGLVGATAGSAGGAQAAELERVGTVAVVRTMELVGTAIVAMRDAPEPRVTLEVALIRCLHPEADDSPLAYLERLERLERRVEELTAHTGTGATVPAERPGADAETPAAPVGAPDALPRPRATAERGPAAARLALGAYGQRPAAGQTGPARPGPARPGPARPAVPTTPTPTAALEAPPVADTTGPDTAGHAPNRDDLVAAWGDGILASLRSRPRAVYQVGRFVDVDGNVATLALPNRAHLEHAEPLRDEVAAILSSHFGTTVELRLVTEESLDPAGPGTARPAGEDAGEIVDEVRDELARGAPAPDDAAPVGDAVVEQEGTSWAADRLLEAFPGAELDQ